MKMGARGGTEEGPGRLFSTSDTSLFGSSCALTPTEAQLRVNGVTEDLSAQETRTWVIRATLVLLLTNWVTSGKLLKGSDPGFVLAKWG